MIGDRLGAASATQPRATYDSLGAFVGDDPRRELRGEHELGDLWLGDGFPPPAWRAADAHRERRRPTLNARRAASRERAAAPRVAREQREIVCQRRRGDPQVVGRRSLRGRAQLSEARGHLTIDVEHRRRGEHGRQPPQPSRSHAWIGGHEDSGVALGRTQASRRAPPDRYPVRMISPRIDRLLENVDSNYASVLVAAKRARQINSYYHNLGEGTFDEFPPPMVDTGSKNYLTIALEEVAAGKIKYQYR